jgi:imidazole glycerol-phosphate synthase subunit HisF
VTGIRIIPCLLLSGRGLVKTIRFRSPRYIGDPINAVRIFNDKEVDELVFLDIGATVQGTQPDFELLSDIASEAFMPFAYGGGITTLDQAKRLIGIGVEKVIVNTAAVGNLRLIEELSGRLGRQSTVVAIDVARSMLGRYDVVTRSGTKKVGRDPVVWAQEVQAAGAGEIIINSVERDGTMSGYDLDLISSITAAVSVPVVACGGAGGLQDLVAAVKVGGASAVAAGSIFVYHGRHQAVLITYPSRAELTELFVGL